jgi:GAF domain-containing protein
MIRRLFSPPVYGKEEDNFRAKFINGFSWTVIVLFVISMLPYLTQPAVDYTPAVLSGLITVMLASLYILHRGNTTASGMIIIILGWLGLGIQAFTADGVKDVVIVGYLALGLLASIIVDWRAGGVVILASIGAIWVLALFEVNGAITPRIQDPIGYSRDLSLTFIAVAVLVYFSTTSLRDAIRRTSNSEKDLLETNKQLQELNLTLENRVTSRTQELEDINQRNKRRASQFEAIAQVARTAVSIQEIDPLLPSLARLIGEKFGFYHVGIFLLDDNKEFAVLQATNSIGGKQMLERSHKLKIGQVGIVGYVTASGNPRIALDVGDDAAFFDNPDLPDTRSELALPLRIAGDTIGALDVQSTEPNAFQQEDVEVLSTLADQVAVAIQNARSYETTQKLLKEAQKASGSYLRDSWQALQLQDESLGYLISNNSMKPLEQPLTSTQVQKAITSRETVKESGETATLVVPIRLRGEVIGVMDIRVPEEHEWEQDEVEIAEAIAERLSLALESATVLKSTQRRVEIERVTADITGKISASTQFDSILRTTAEELSRVFGGSEVVVQVHQPESTGTEA